MRILHISTGYTPILPDSGRSVENTIYQLSKWQAELGHNVAVVDIRSSKPRGETKARFCEVRVPRWGGLPYSAGVILYALLSMPLIWRLVASGGVDIIHTHSQLPTLVAVMVNKLLRAKALIFYTAHSPYLTMPQSLSNRLKHTIVELWALRWADRVVAQTDAVAGEIRRRFSLDDSKVVQVHAGVNVDEIDEFARRHPRSNSNRVILCPAYINRRKNQMAVVKAIPRVTGVDPNCAFIFTGHVEDAGYFAEIEEYLSKGGILNARFAGYVPKGEFYQLFRDAAMVVFPTLFETQGVVLLEAMAFGLPVVASNIEAIKDVVKLKEGCALLVKPSDSEEIGDAIIRVLHDRRLRERLSRRGRELVGSRFSWERIARDTINEYVGAGSQVAQEWVEGRYPKGWEIIDIGAGSSPAEGATRAVDANRDLFTKDGRRLKKKVRIPASLKEYVNYDASNLPYGDGFFERGLSRWGIGARIHGEKPIRELYRVLKRDGEVYIAILEEDRKYIPATKRLLKKVGFAILGVYNGAYLGVTRKGKDVEARECVIHARK